MCHHLIVKISINLKVYLKIAFREKMTKYLEEGASLSRPSASDRTVNLFDQNKTVNQRWTELIQWAVGLVKSSALLQRSWILLHQFTWR